MKSSFPPKFAVFVSSSQSQPPVSHSLLVLLTHLPSDPTTLVTLVLRSPPSGRRRHPIGSNHIRLLFYQFVFFLRRISLAQCSAHPTQDCVSHHPHHPITSPHHHPHHPITPSPSPAPHHHLTPSRCSTHSLAGSSPSSSSCLEHPADLLT